MRNVETALVALPAVVSEPQESIGYYFSWSDVPALLNGY